MVVVVVMVVMIMIMMVVVIGSHEAQVGWAHCVDEADLKSFFILPQLVLPQLLERWEDWQTSS